MTSFFKKLDKYMKHKGLNDNKFTVETGISNGLIGKARKRGSLSQENISKILHTYPELDANWLFMDEMDEGEMLKNAENTKQNSIPNALENTQAKLILMQDEKIQGLKSETKELKAEVIELKNELKKAYDGMASHVERKLKSK